ncbi:MAG: hypothetical protein FWG05_01080, partial [Kiritimatiellaeota bacterium]|nr:hypothetical protein [Kiritimatiellota bacterium]
WFGGPGNLTNGVWLVFAGIKTDTQIKARGFGPHRTILAKAGAAVATHLETPRTLFAKRGGFDCADLHFRTYEHAPDYDSLLVFAAFNPLDAATLLLDWGSPQTALDFLNANNAFPSGNTFCEALAGNANATRALTRRWNEILSDPTPPQLTTDGIPLEDYDAFARVRAPSQAVFPPSWNNTNSTVWTWRDALSVRLRQIEN